VTAVARGLRLLAAAGALVLVLVVLSRGSAPVGLPSPPSPRASSPDTSPAAREPEEAGPAASRDIFRYADQPAPSSTHRPGGGGAAAPPPPPPPPGGRGAAPHPGPLRSGRALGRHSAKGRGLASRARALRRGDAGQGRRARRRARGPFYRRGVRRSPPRSRGPRGHSPPARLSVPADTPASASGHDRTPLERQLLAHQGAEAWHAPRLPSRREVGNGSRGRAAVRGAGLCVGRRSDLGRHGGHLRPHLRAMAVNAPCL
jgi:hypothetical protein